MAKFKTKPFEIDAVLYEGDPNPLYAFCGWEFAMLPPDKQGEFNAMVHDKLHETWVFVKPGQWIIRGQKGEFYPCDPEIFEAKYEAVDE